MLCHYHCSQFSPKNRRDVDSWLNVKLKTATKTDPVLARVLQFVKEGWPREVLSSLKTFLEEKVGIINRRRLYSVGQSGGYIPGCYRRKLLHELYTSHPGMWWMKHWEVVVISGLDLIRTWKRWWRVVLPVLNWRQMLSELPYIHGCGRGFTWFCGPTKWKKMYFLVVDSHSKWPEVCKMNSTLL